jgi:hypothetical protein
MTEICPSPLRGWGMSSIAAGGYATLHHRLISGVPQGRSVIPDLCRNFSFTVCRTLNGEAIDEAPGGAN